MVKTQKQTGGLDPVQRLNLSEKILETLQPVFGGTNPTPRRIPLGSTSKVDAITDLKKGKRANPSLYPLRRSQPAEYQGSPPERSPTFVNVGSRAAQKRCIPVPQQAKAKPMVVGTRRVDIPSAVGVQRSGNRPMVAYTKYMSDNLNTRVIHPFQQEMTKRQRTGIRLMAVGAWRADLSPRVETNPYLKWARQMGKGLIFASMHQTDFGLMAVSQWTVMPRVIAEQQTNTYP